eukprot:scaffold1982_cov93-Amphora_coffeaeformis.AAC.22
MPRGGFSLWRCSVAPSVSGRIDGDPTADVDCGATNVYLVRVSVTVLIFTGTRIDILPPFLTLSHTFVWSHTQRPTARIPSSAITFQRVAIP